MKCERSIEIIIQALQKVKSFVLKTGFKSEDEEISFFKEIKPLFTSKRIYHNSIYRIETKKPSGSTRILKKYYNNELEKLKRYFDDNLDFYKYYRTKSTYLDYKYFIRGAFDVKQSLDNFYYEADLNFTTSHYFKIAKILAHDLLQLNFKVRTYNPEKGTPENSIFILSRGKNAGKPLFEPCPNCFILYCRNETEKENLYWIFYTLWKNGFFHPYLCGSVIDMLRLSELKKILQSWIIPSFFKNGKKCKDTRGHQSGLSVRTTLFQTIEAAFRAS